ncbi:MAG: 2-C-methyl-D-erythritol 4-phosphate cytidylyltransferase [Treponema sp.]|jgi:2-C-methyl-D-erythritol 4-phosphate cytidylyltransferase|nr:2-C-methyl-D-erythritol 4-phosphate cytidylyltransferase [Treponema sp.]
MTAVIVCAAGASSRMNGVKKEFLPLEGRFDTTGNPLTVIGSAVSVFVSSKRIDIIVIVTLAKGEQKAHESLPPSLLGDVSTFFVEGGATRFASVHNALKALVPLKPDYVLVHDGARPWINIELVNAVVDATVRYGAVVPLVPLVETPKEVEDVNGGRFVRRHLRRSHVAAAQTPQGFRFAELLDAYEKAALVKKEYTDDAEVWGEFCGSVAVVSGLNENKKITFPEDTLRVLDNFTTGVVRKGAPLTPS